MGSKGTAVGRPLDSIPSHVHQISLINLKRMLLALHNCGTTREGEVDLVHPLKAGFETDPNSNTQPALDPSSKLALAACSKLTLTAYIRLGRGILLVNHKEDHDGATCTFEICVIPERSVWVPNF